MVNLFRRKQRVQLLLCYLIAISFANDVSMTVGGRAAASSRTRIAGWTKVNERWPITSQDYFYAATKGHHQIEVRLPETIDSDLEVSLEYYYKFAKVRPFIQIVPCKSNVDILTDEGAQSAGSWQTDRRLVKMDDCLQRKKLAYNVILHDDEDVFAWKVLEIKSKQPETQPITTESPATTTESPATTTTESPTTTTESPATTTTTADSVASTTDATTTTTTAASTTTTEVATTTTTTSTTTTEATTTTTSTETPLSPPGSPQRPQPSEPENQNEHESATTTTTTTTTEATSAIPDRNRDESNGGDSQEPPGSPKQPDSDAANNGDQQHNNPDQNKNENENEHHDREHQNENQNGNQNENQNKDQNENQNENRDESQNGNQNGNQNGDQNGNQNENQNGDQNGNQNENQNGDQNGNQNGDQNKNQNENQNGNQNENRDSTEGNPGQQHSRKKRATSMMSLICKPNSCDRNQVHFPTFKTLIGGLSELSGEQLASETYSYHLNTKNEPLKLEMDSDVDDLADYNLCLDMSLYMDEGTSLSLYLDDGDANKKEGRLLETIERKAGDQMSSKWERVERCMLDYMPRLAKARPNGPSGEPHDEIHKIKLNLLPKSGAPERQKVLVKLATQEAISKRPYLEPLSHLPNALNAANEQDVRRMWIADRDGPMKAKFRFGHKQPTPGTGGGGGDGAHSPQRVLFVDSIEPKQDYFDLTSRWLKVDSPDAPLDDVVVFNYTADRADWIKAIDFEFQRASSAHDYWQAERIYTRPAAENSGQPPRPPGQQNYEQITDGATGETTGVRPVSAARPQHIGGPIHVKGLKRGDYRLRLRHHVDQDPRIMPNLDRHQLAIRSLSFGDACSGERPFCLNGGKCVPKGLSRAECVCPRGYSGDHCELKRPCEILYAGRTGTDFCHSVGAACIEDLPVFRCIWPDDQYYQCRRTWKGSEGSPSGGGGGDGTGAKDDEDDRPSRSEQVDKLIEATNKQKQIIFVMGAFMAAMMLFAIVIVINMIMKLRKSNSRLKRVQIEVHELTRQNTPSTSGGLAASAPPFGRPGARNKPAAVMAYNNRAFDAAGS